MPFDLSQYEPVEDRLRAFWSEHPDGRVITELVRAEAGEFIVLAKVYRGIPDAHPAATGLASESVTDRGVNATSALENCETSAVGRALANLGLSPKGKRPSREEMSKASPEQRAAGDGGGPEAVSVPPAESSTKRASGPPTTCSHKYANGADAKVIVKGMEICRLCRQPWVSVVEGTTADLGAAK